MNPLKASRNVDSLYEICYDTDNFSSISAIYKNINQKIDTKKYIIESV